MSAEISRELLDDCVHCGFCLPTCPTYGPLWQEEMDSPRGRILLMSGLVDGTVALSPTTVRHFDRCLGCMACVTSCPSGVRYDRLIEQTRAHVEEHHERSDDERILRALLFATVPYPRRLRAALALTPPRLPGPLAPFAALKPPWRSSARPPEVTPPAAERRLRVGLLLGCVQRVVFGDVNVATARVLAAEGCEVAAPRVQECCGALHLHAGRLAEGRRRAQRIGEVFGDVDAIVVNAAGCGSHLKEAELPVRVVDVNELLAELEPRAERHELPLRIAYQDACHLGHAQGIRDAPREVLGSIPGLEVAEPAEQAICCGSAGIYNLVQPAPAAELGERKAANVAATGADAYASANPGCLVQVSTHLRRAGTPLSALHPVELLDASIRGVSRDALVAAARR
ncbi:MAG TPA: heterodisulfide reductase-related iron-sulfur binding cluster [Gaiellaceae bacterium]